MKTQAVLMLETQWAFLVPPRHVAHRLVEVPTTPGYLREAVLVAS